MRHMTAADVASACAYAADKNFIFASSLFWLNRRNFCRQKVPGCFPPIAKRIGSGKSRIGERFLTGSFIERRS
jgi:hypothetical protein